MAGKPLYCVKLKMKHFVCAIVVNIFSMVLNKMQLEHTRYIWHKLDIVFLLSSVCSVKKGIKVSYYGLGFRCRSRTSNRQTA